MHFINPQRICKGMEMGDIPSERSIVRDTITIAWPSVLESFFVCLAGMMDTIMVGSLGSYAIAAVGLSTQPKFLGLAIFLSMNVAVSAVVARRRGEGDREGANRVVRMALLATILLTVVVSAAFVLLASPIVKLVGSQPDTHEYAVEYLQIIMGGTIFNTVSLVLNAAQRGAGNTRIAMTTNLVSNVVNICFNYLLIGGNFGFPALGVRGAAIATVLGTVCACVMSLISCLHKDGFIYLGAVKSWVADRFNIGIVMSPLLVVWLYLLFGSYQKPGQEAAFAIGLLISAAALLWPPTAWWLIAFALGLVYMKAFTWRSITALILGVATTVWLLYSIGQLFDLTLFYPFESFID